MSLINQQHPLHSIKGRVSLQNVKQKKTFGVFSSIVDKGLFICRATGTLLFLTLGDV